MTKDENIKKETEVVKSRSTRHALARVLKAVQLHMPPDGISERDAMGMIIEAVDPMPDDFDSEKCIKEVMNLVADYEQSSYDYEKCYVPKTDKKEAWEAIEAKLRQLIQ